jgi:hypothetical protein
MQPQIVSDFERAALSQTERGLVREAWDFLRHTKKWWLMPILVAFMLLTALVVLSGGAMAPFIYTLF